MACDCSLCIPNRVHVVVINAGVSSWEKKISRDILVFKSNRNRPLCTHHWLLHFAIEISTLRQICKYTKRRIKLEKGAWIGKEKKRQKIAKERGGGNPTLKYLIAWNVHSQFDKMFAAGNIETLLDFKDFATPWKEAKADKASEWGWARRRERVWCFQGPIKCRILHWIKN